MKKRGDMKWDILIALILGIIVLGLSLYLLFNEYFTKEDINWEACRQSVYLRASIPEASMGDYDLVSFKEQFPLKCTNDVIEITKKDIENGDAGRIIVDTMVQCWYLFGNGDYQTFPSQIFPRQTNCVPCARISLTDEANTYLREENSNISIEGTLNNESIRINGLTYKNYLDEVGSQYSAFNLGFGRAFDLKGENFSIDTKDFLENSMKNKGTGFVEKGTTFFFFDGITFSKVSLPEVFYPDRGDLLIIYGSATSNENMNGHIPYLFYFQAGQEPNPFDEMDKIMISGRFWTDQKVCSDWDGIPA
jgi:hypothetical protein